MASKRYATVEERDCVACGTCEGVCPKAAITVKNGCCAEVDREQCVGCGKCAKECPTGCIGFQERV